MTALQYFRLLAPEFASLSDEVVSTWLTMSANVINASCLDAERQAMAQALYAAHWYAVTPRTSTSGGAALGAITSEREGDLQRTYSGLQGSDTWLGQTSYGQQYKDLTRPCSGMGILTRNS